MADDLPDDWFRPRAAEPAADDAVGAAQGDEPGRGDADDDQTRLRQAERAPAPSPSTQSATSATSATTVSQWVVQSQVPAGGATSGQVPDDERYTDQFKPGYLTHPPRRRGVDPVQPTDRPATIPVVASMPGHPQPAAAVASSEGGSRRVRRSSWLGRHPALATIGVVLVALAVGLSTGQLLRNRDAAQNPSASAPGTVPSGATQTGGGSSTRAVKPWDGLTKPLAASGVTASCTADPAKDTQGTEVTYDASHVLDDDNATAWRCNGDGLTQSLIFTFPKGSTLVGVGVLNGYAKSSTGTALYPEYRRVTSVEWRLADGSWFSQNLSDNNMSVQQVSIPPTVIDGPVVMTITSSTQPGNPESTRNAVLLSRVVFVTQG